MNMGDRRPSTPEHSATTTQLNDLTTATRPFAIADTPDFSTALIKWKPPKVAVAALLGTYELLEQILLDMPKPRSKTTMKAILLSQRVRRMSRGVVQRSEEIQRLLFYKPCARSIIMSACIAWNPLLKATGSKEKRCISRSRPAPHPNSADGHGYLCIGQVYLHGEQRLRVSQPLEETESESWQKMLLAQNYVE